MNHNKPTIYTAICFFAFIALLMIASIFGHQLNIITDDFKFSLSSSYFLSYITLIALYILIILPISAKFIGKKLSNKIWLKHHLIFSTAVISILTLTWIALTDNEANKPIIIISSSLTFLLIFLAGQLWLYIYNRVNSSTSVLNFINKNFNGFNIEKEFDSLSRNKIFLLRKENEHYILKISRKNIRHTKVEVDIMSRLQSYVQMPTLISHSVKSPPRYVLMTYNGPRLSHNNEVKYYYTFGKLIAQIGDIHPTNFISKSSNNKSTRKIQNLIKNTNLENQYLEYLRLYPKFSTNYFAHGDLSLTQAMLDGDIITIIDWESACLSYQLTDLARALSHTMSHKLTVKHAQAIFKGYNSINQLSNVNEVKFLLGLIWLNLHRTNEVCKPKTKQQKRVEFLTSLLADGRLEEVFKLHPR